MTCTLSFFNLQNRQISYFTDTLRRVIYVSRLLKYSTEALKEIPDCPRSLKMDCTNISNAINRFFLDCSVNVTPEKWASVMAELNGDSLHELSLLLDTMQDVTNIEEIRLILEEHKTQQIHANE